MMIWPSVAPEATFDEVVDAFIEQLGFPEDVAESFARAGWTGPRSEAVRTKTETKARDGDGDGFVFDGTPKMRPVIPGVDTAKPRLKKPDPKRAVPKTPKVDRKKPKLEWGAPGKPKEDEDDYGPNLIPLDPDNPDFLELMDQLFGGPPDKKPKVEQTEPPEKDENRWVYEKPDDASIDRLVDHSYTEKDRYSRPLAESVLVDDDHLRQRGQALFRKMGKDRMATRTRPENIDEWAAIATDFENTYGVRIRMPGRGGSEHTPLWEDIAKGEWAFFGGARKVRKAAWRMMGYHTGEVERVDPHLNVRSSHYAGSTDTDDIALAHAFTLMRGIEESEPLSAVTYRGVYLDEGQRDAFVKNIEENGGFTMPLVSITNDKDSALGLFGGKRSVLIQFEEGVKGVKGVPLTNGNIFNLDADMEREYITGGQFELIRVERGGDGPIVVHVRQAGIFDPNYGWVAPIEDYKATQAKAVWKYDYLFDGSLSGILLKVEAP